VALFALVPLVLATTAAGLMVRDDPPARTADPVIRPAQRADIPRTQILVVRRRGGVPSSWTRRVRRTPGVGTVARTARTQVLLRRGTRARGATVDAAPPGYAIPLDVLVVRPRPYADVLPEARPDIHRLRRGTALLSRSSARLRRLGVGDRLNVVGAGELRVAGIVDDQLAGLAELVLTTSRAAGGRDRTEQLLVTTTRPERIERRFAREDGVRVRSVSPSVTSSPRLIARPVEIKARFGEFAVRLPYGEDWIGIDPAWLRRNVVTQSVPILGAVTCNRRLLPPLRRALRTLERRGLSHVVDRADYAGCHAPRRIPGSGSLSLHAWGLAIDINAAANQRLRGSRQDRRLVRAMEEAGFTWGGRWPTVPDPMHFELHAVPRAR
jgi:hypothetical protein